MSEAKPTLPARCVAEAIGTFVLVFLGCGAVHSAVLTGSQSGLWQVAIVWGVAVMLGIYIVGGISGAHINPAITLAMLAWRQFPAHWVVPYIASQLVGAALAASCLLLLFGPYLEQRERELHLVRGEPGSELTAMCFGEYFPNPGGMESSWRRDLLDAGQQKDSVARTQVIETYARLVTPWTAFFAEVLGTFLLALVVFAVTEEDNPAAPQNRLGPVFIGLTVAVLISVIAPLTQACFNPARDFGPRLVAGFAGWGDVAWTGHAGLGATLLVYALGPCAGALAGATFFSLVLRPVFQHHREVTT